MTESGTTKSNQGRGRSQQGHRRQGNRGRGRSTRNNRYASNNSDTGIKRHTPCQIWQTKN